MHVIQPKEGTFALLDSNLSNYSSLLFVLLIITKIVREKVEKPQRNLLWDGSVVGEEIPFSEMYNCALKKKRG